MVTHRSAIERHLPYVITRCHQPLDTRERASPQPQPGRPVLDLPTPEGWKAELILFIYLFIYLQTTIIMQ